MQDTISIHLAQRGLVTLPKALRDAYQLKAGDDMTLLDLGGVFVLSPHRSQVDALGNSIREALLERGETLESMLSALRESREKYAE